VVVERRNRQMLAIATAFAIRPDRDINSRRTGRHSVRFAQLPRTTGMVTVAFQVVSLSKLPKNE
jgi:hypothetical protein